MTIYTIGFTQKSAETFFEQLKSNEIDLLLDIRLNARSQLAGFAKEKDLQYFVNIILNANYIHELEFAPTDDLLSRYRKKEIQWSEYVNIYNNLLIKRNAEKIFATKYKNKYNNICLLCSEATADNCHRRLLAEYLREYDFATGITEIVHL